MAAAITHAAIPTTERRRTFVPPERGTRVRAGPSILVECAVDGAVESVQDRAAMALRVQLQVVGQQAYLFGRTPRWRSPQQIRPVGRVTGALEEPRGERAHGFDQPPAALEERSVPELERAAVRLVNVWIQTFDERI